MNNKNPFEYQHPSDSQVAKITRVREACKMVHKRLLEDVQDSRERAIAITKLEEVSMWANKAIVFETKKVAVKKSK